MTPFETRVWWALVARDVSQRWGALANARAAVARDRAVATQRVEANRALERLAVRTGGRSGTRAS